MFFNGSRSNEFKIEPLTTGKNGLRNILRLCGGKDKNDVGWRFLQGFK